MLSLNLSKTELFLTLTKTLQCSIAIYFICYRQFGLSSCYVFSSISDADLDQAVRRHIEHNDHIGPNAVRAILFNEGHRVRICLCFILNFY